MILEVLLRIPINPKYPTRPNQPSARDAVENALSDALQHHDVRQPGTPITCTIKEIK